MALGGINHISGINLKNKVILDVFICSGKLSKYEMVREERKTFSSFVFSDAQSQTGEINFS